MLRRFMNWLLHQLQKLLSALGGRRPSSRPLASPQDTAASPDATPQKAGSPIADDSSSAEISFSLQSADVADRRAADPQKEATQSAIDYADDAADTHTRLDATPSTVPGSQADPLDAEGLLSDQSTSTDSDSTFLPADQLPSIHDLLPAVEQEIKANSAQFDEVTVQPDEVAVAADDDLEVPEVRSSELEISDVDRAELEDEAQVTKAVLFSFDITESSQAEAADLVTDNVVEPERALSSSEPSEEEISRSVAVDSLAELEETVAEPDVVEADVVEIDVVETTAAETETDAIAIAPSPESKTDLTDSSQTQPLIDLNDVETATSSSETVSADLDSTPLDTSSLPYPWSLATPRNASNRDEDSAVITSEAPKQLDIEVKQESNSEPEAVKVSSNNAVFTQSVQDSAAITKNGVVKLLFTMKEGNFHGYIEPKDGTPDILFHQKYINEDIFGSLERGVEVVVSVRQMEGKAYATQVELAS